ncbi:Serine/threonine kinase, partial [Coemansia sp. BCRC 34490]
MHCGNMLPIGRRSVKCTSCSGTCHIGCQQYVPNFCGLDMMKASAMMLEIKRAKGGAVPKPKLLTKRDTVAKKPTTPSTVSAPSADAQVASIQSNLEKLSIPSDNAPGRYQSPSQPTSAPYNAYSAGAGPSASPIPSHIAAQALPPNHQRANSNEFVPIKSTPVSPVGQQQHMMSQQQQRPQGMGQPADHRLSQIGGGYPPNTMVQAPSYYQQQIQQAKVQYSPQMAQPQQPYNPYVQQQQQQPQQFQPGQQQQPQQPYNPYAQQQQHQLQLQQQQQQQQQGYPAQQRMESMAHYQQQQQQYGRQSAYGAVGVPVQQPQGQYPAQSPQGANAM